MRAFFTIIYILLFVSCNQSNYRKLEVADSLMTTKPDSAFRILKSVNAGKLVGSEIRAYYGLLYTQAQFKNYETIENDSLISSALEFYQGSSDICKLTQAYMYKGVAMSDKEMYREAISWYKKADAIADTSDYMTCGLINFRIGELYQNSFTRNDEDIDRYKKALGYFRKAEHDVFENQTMRFIGQVYIQDCYDSASVYLNQALKMARERGDVKEVYTNIFQISNLYKYYNVRLEEAKNNLLELYQHKALHGSGYYGISELYAKLGLLDSAEYYSKLAQLPKYAIDSLRFSVMNEGIAKAKGDYKSAYENYKSGTIIADSLIKARGAQECYAIEKEFDNTVVNLQAERYRLGNQIRNYVIVLVILVVIIVLIVLYLIIKRKNTINQDNKMMIERLQQEVYESDNILLEKLDNESKLKQVLRNQIMSIKELIESSYRSEGDSTKFMEKFYESVRINKLSHGMWKDLRYIVDQQYDGILSDIKETYPQLDESDLNLISLMCCGFSYIEITICLGYENERSTCNRRLKVARRMGLKTPLDQFIKKMMENRK